MDTDFLGRLASIVVVDLLLAGDNAVVIAMAVRTLPPAQRRKGILLGAAAAVALRVVLTFFVSQLLQVSLVKLAGGLLILWIAVKLFATGEEEAGGRDAAGVGDAVKLIVLADVTMSLDNMLAVGGVSHGDPLLLGIGLAVSIPFVVFTSDLLSRLMDRHAWIVYVGAGILGKVGGEMIMTDPTTVAYVHPPQGAIWATEAALAVLVIFVGKLRAARPASPQGGDLA